jgi:hypothetical protein
MDGWMYISPPRLSRAFRALSTLPSCYDGEAEGEKIVILLEDDVRLELIDG